MKHTFQCLKLTNTKNLGEHFVRICSTQFKDIAGQSASENHLKPWRGRVVRVSTKDGAVLRLLKGHGSLQIGTGRCWIGPQTRSQLCVEPGMRVMIEMMPIQWVARWRYYNCHLDDSVRFSFRIGFWGLVFAVVSILLTLFW